MKEYILIFVFLLSCSSFKTNQQKLKESYTSLKFDEAKLVLNSKEFKDKENELLRLLEIASVSYYEGDFVQALILFKEAQDLSDVLYTKSIRELILSGFMGDEYTSFYGKIYERSAMFHMQAKIMFELYSKGQYRKSAKDIIILSDKERKDYLLKARAIVIAWNSFYQTIQREQAQNYFAYDYHQQILAALIHEEIGTNSDMQIALILYKNTYNDLDKLIALYRDFNSKSEEAIESYFENKKIKNIEYTKKTEHLINFLKFKILFLTKKMRRNNFNQEVAKLKPTKEILNSLEKKMTTIIFSNEVLDVMQTKIIAYNLNWVLDKIKDPALRSLVDVIGVSALSYFTLGTLGFSTYSSYNDGRYVYRATSLPNELIKNIGIEVKIPYIDPSSTIEDLLLEVDGKSKSYLSKLNNYQDKMYLSTRQFANKYYNTIGPKIALKYLVAIVAAYQTNKKLKENNQPLANMITLAQFLLSSKAISTLQSVDTRHWIGIPRNSYYALLELDEGEHEILIKTKKSDTVISKQNIKILPKAPSLFFL